MYVKAQTWVTVNPEHSPNGIQDAQLNMIMNNDTGESKILADIYVETETLYSLTATSDFIMLADNEGSVVHVFKYDDKVLSDFLESWKSNHYSSATKISTFFLLGFFFFVLGSLLVKLLF